MIQTQAQLELVQCLAQPDPRQALGHWWERWMTSFTVQRVVPPESMQLTPDEQLEYERHYVSHQLADALLSHGAMQLRPSSVFDHPYDVRTYTAVVLTPPQYPWPYGG